MSHPLKSMRQKDDMQEFPSWGPTVLKWLPVIYRPVLGACVLIHICGGQCRCTAVSSLHRCTLYLLTSLAGYVLRDFRNWLPAPFSSPTFWPISAKQRSAFFILFPVTSAQFCFYKGRPINIDIRFMAKKHQPTKFHRNMKNDAENKSCSCFRCRSNTEQGVQ